MDPHSSWPEREGVGTVLGLDDPFEDALELLFLAAYDHAEVKTAFIDVQYDDPAHNYHRLERLRLEGDATEQKLRLVLLDRTMHNYRFRVSLVGQDGCVTQQVPVDTTETLVAVRVI